MNWKHEDQSVYWSSKIDSISTKETRYMPYITSIKHSKRSEENTQNKQKVNSIGFPLSKIALLLLSFSPLFVQAQTREIDPTLAELIKVSINAHPSVRAAQSGVKALDMDVEIAKLQRYPSFGVQSQLQSGSSGARNVTAIVQQPIWTGGRIDAQIEASSATARAGVEHIDEVRDQLALQTINNWQMVIASKEKIETIQNLLKRYDEYSEMMKRRIEARISPRMEGELVKSRVAQTHVDLQQAQTSLALGLDRLSQLTGRKITVDMVVGDSNLQKKSEQIDVEHFKQIQNSTLDEVIANAPSLRKAKQDTLVAKANAKLASAGRFPVVSLTASQRLLESSNNSNTSKFSAGLNVNYEMGAGLSVFEKARSAEQRVQTAELEVERLTLDVRDAIQTEIKEASASKMRVDSLIAAVSTSEEVLSSYERQFVGGRRGWQEVMNAVRELGDNEKALIDARASFIASLYRLGVRLSELPWQQEVLVKKD